MNNSAGTKTEGINLFRKIGFQNLAVNIVMLVMFVTALLIMNSNTKNIINSAVGASNDEIQLLSKEAKLREGLITIDGNLSALLGAVSMGPTIPPIMKCILPISMR